MVCGVFLVLATLCSADNCLDCFFGILARFRDSSVSKESYREEIEFEEQEEVDHNSNEVKSDLEEGPYSEEPLPDDKWMKEYTRER